MRITRNKSSLFTRRARRGRGCLPLLVLISVAVAVVALGRNWIGQWLNLNRLQNTEISLQSAQSAFDSGDLSTAIDYASQLIERNPSDEVALRLLIRTLIYQSYTEYNRVADRERALAFSRDGISRFPGSLDMQAMRAYALQVIGRPEEANRMALRIIDRSPEHVLARIVLSLSYGSQGIFEAALREGNVAVELATQYSQFQMESYRTRAFAYANVTQYESAILDIDRAITLNRKLIPLHFERASYAIQLGDTDQATVSYFQIMAFDDANVKVRLRMCELSSSLQELDSAIRYCGEVTQNAPEWADGWYQLGREFFLKGDFVNALASFNQCSTLQVQQQTPITERELECWYLQGQSAEILGNCDALLRIYHEFLEMADRGNLPQTWTYPPEGPPICADVPPTVTAIYTSP